MNKSRVEKLGMAVIVVLAVANLNSLGAVAGYVGGTLSSLAHHWHGLVAGSGETSDESHLDGHGQFASVVAQFETSGDLETRKAALYALAESEVDDATLVPMLEEIATHSRWSELSRAAVYVLGDVESHALVVPALARILDKSPHRRVRKAAVYALGEIQTPEARSVLLKILEGTTA